jgi:hypothetical protein
MTLQQLGCRGMVTKRSKTASMCWTCGHSAKTVSGKCECCNQVVRKHEDKELLAIKQNFDDCINGLKEAEFRFYTERWVYWVKLSTLEDYKKLKNVDSFERYHYFLKKNRDNGTLTRVIRL